MAGQCYCERCQKVMADDNFYTSNNLEKYPNGGKMNMCKKCLTAHIDNWNPDTYKWVLQELDVPYVPKEWDKILAARCKDVSKVTGMTVLGRYLSVMKLKHWQKYRWADTEYIQELENKKIEETMRRSGYQQQQIDDAINKATFDLNVPPPPPPQAETAEDLSLTSGQNYFDIQNGIDESADDLDLTDEDKLYLRMKWGKTYKPEEWVRLETMYNEMMDSYDIHSAGHIDTLKLVCKTSLKANQLIDIGDIEGFQKMSRVYDSLMKSGSFTGLQNKQANDQQFDSIGELVALCEKEGFIPRYYTSGPQDHVDETLRDLEKYTHDLITEEMNLGNLIENAIKKMQEEEDKAEDADIEEELSYDNIDLIEEADFEEHFKFLDDQGALDDEFYKSIEEGDA